MVMHVVLMSPVQISNMHENLGKRQIYIMQFTKLMHDLERQSGLT